MEGTYRREWRVSIIILAAALLFALVVAAPAASARSAPLIVDHTSANLTPIPASAIADARSDLHVAYGHTSHGSQLVTGMDGLQTFAGAPLPPATYAFNEGGTGGALDLDDYFVDGDLGNPDFSSWASRTRAYLNLSENSGVNVVMWSWCGQVSWASEADIATYLTLMDGLERDFPSVTFVYMTGHLDGTGVTGNLHLRNQQIRSWCRDNNRVLYDFADIESYDPDGIGYLAAGANDGCAYSGGNWAQQWQASHTVGEDWYLCYPAHTEPLNGNLKAYAAWHLFARLAGWDPGSTVRQLPSGVGLPTDTDVDGLYEDVNGNGRTDFADVVLYFNQMTWISANEPVAGFDYNDNGRIDFADVVWLFHHL
jgi:PKD repeat protein